MRGCFCFCFLDLLILSSLWLSGLEFNTYAYQDGCRRVKFLPPETGQYLDGHVFMNLTTGMYTPCEHRCVMQKKCVSVNISPSIEDKVICELSDSDHLQHPEDLKIRPGWTYRGTDNLCCSNPCLNNATCLMGYTDKRYSCECSPGYTGENCEKDCCSNLLHLEKYQDLPTRGAIDVEQFDIEGSLFLAFANAIGDIEKLNTDSFIYKLNKSTGNFTLYQTIDTAGAKDIECFTIADKHYLAVANHYDDSTYKINSTIYQWNGHQFVVFQTIPTIGAISLNFFKIFPQLFLAFANHWDGNTHRVNSVIYKWKDNHFERFQEIPTEGASSSTVFVINNETFIAFANRSPNSPQSHLYKWSGESFIKEQSFPTSADFYVKSYRINTDTFIIFTNDSGGFIYKWNGTKFAPFQSFPIGQRPSINPFEMCAQQYFGLATSSALGVYRFNGSQFIKCQELPHHHVNNIISFESKGHTYLAMAITRGLDNRYNIYSTIYMGPN